jgi:hypothetical protein
MTFYIEVKANLSVKGWPTPNPKPYRVYENGQVVSSFATLKEAKAFAAKAAAKASQ